ncbi:MAG: Asp23/Gls24 family envelope stress response protein [Peptostreptococcaceae bacterium]|nr:Asp23/Gls24 family envelope stress response protein [Peptostreptococcaceae bacterium]MDY5739853.1 Asp23/Gls24 family envelope stress response protein [Anaerovoracaceae bacterium]SFE20633.1 hypothetical protein SAMN02910327_00623 [Peptostreptococcaceae bacterium pGA-8]
MKVYTLVGKSGTGKSYHALSLCKELNIEAIIDDGLLIYRDQVIAGVSAKRQATTVGAIKTALFTKNEHRDVVVSALARINPESILVLGTSDRMVLKIIGRLSIPFPIRQINIEDITTEEERAAANKQRHVLGKHVIPVPSPQIKRDFAGYFVDPLRVIRDLGIVGGKAQKRGNARDLSVVRPTFSYLGEFFISTRVLRDIVMCVGRNTIGIRRVAKIIDNMEIDSLIVDVQVVMDHSVRLYAGALEFQMEISRAIETMTAFNVLEVNVEVIGVV